MTFSTWLKRQRNRIDAVGTLAEEACTDSKFPRRAKFTTVKNHINKHRNDSLINNALEKARVEFLQTYTER
jgi:uncharacterized protein YozE (UPF0346 family)